MSNKQHLLSPNHIPKAEQGTLDILVVLVGVGVGMTFQFSRVSVLEGRDVSQSNLTS